MEKIATNHFESRIRSKSSAQEFFQNKLGLYLPDDSCFNTKFLLEVFSGRKKLIPLTVSVDIKLGRAKASTLFDKKNLLQVIKARPAMNLYLPTDVTCQRVERKTLLSVSWFLSFR